jgi:hypothetical protein
MKSIFLACFVLGIAAVAAFGAEDGLYVPVPKAEMKTVVENGFAVTRVPIKRVNLLRATFRVDTENPELYWMELDFAEWHDPGDYYFFRLKEKDYGGFVVRGNGGTEGGGRWARGFTDLKEGREFLKEVAAAYRLKAEAIHDATKGTPVAAPKP